MSDPAWLFLSHTAGVRANGKPNNEISFREFQAFTFGSLGELEVVFGSEAAARRRWDEIRTDFLDQWDLWGRPEAWWLFEPGVPEELRAGPSAIITSADARRWDELDRARRDHLRSIGIDPTPKRRYTAFGTD
jgi:hypothetical protein